MTRSRDLLRGSLWLGAFAAMIAVAGLLGQPS